MTRTTRPDADRTIPRLAVVLISVFGLLAVSACSDGDFEVGVTDDDPTPLATLQAASVRSSERPTITVSATATIDGEVVSSFEMTSSRDGSAGTGTIGLPVVGTIGVLWVPEGFYVALPDLPDGAEWVVVDTGKLKGLTGLDPSGLAGSELLEQLVDGDDGTFDVEVIGPSELRGTPVTHYRITTDMAELRQRFGDIGVPPGRADRGAAAGDGDRDGDRDGDSDGDGGRGATSTADVFVDDAGDVRGISYELDLRPGSDRPGKVFAFELAFDYGDEPFELVAPSSDTVASVLDLFRTP